MVQRTGKTVRRCFIAGPGSRPARWCFTTGHVTGSSRSAAFRRRAREVADHAPYPHSDNDRPHICWLTNVRAGTCSSMPKVCHISIFTCVTGCSLLPAELKPFRWVWLKFGARDRDRSIQVDLCLLTRGSVLKKNLRTTATIIVI